jgi:hypothetical protein
MRWGTSGPTVRSGWFARIQRVGICRHIRGGAESLLTRPLAVETGSAFRSRTRSIKRRHGPGHSGRWHRGAEPCGARFSLNSLAPLGTTLRGILTKPHLVPSQTGRCPIHSRPSIRRSMRCSGAEARALQRTRLFIVVDDIERPSENCRSFYETILFSSSNCGLLGGGITFSRNVTCRWSPPPRT